MATLKTNMVATGASALFLSAAAYAGWQVFTEPTDNVVESAAEQKISPIFGSDGDGTSDTIRTLRATVEEQRAEMQELMAQNERVMADNKRTLSALSNSDKRTELAVKKAMIEQNGAATARTSHLEDAIESLKNGMESFTSRATEVTTAPAPLEKTEIVSGFGLDGGAIRQYDAAIDIVWVTPADEAAPSYVIGSNANNPQSLGEIPASAGAAYGGGSQTRVSPAPVKKVKNASREFVKTAQSDPDKTREIQRYFTLPDLSALSGGVAVTSLVGRVYDKEIRDPYPFKISIGRNNFAASFVELPDEIVGMLYEGYAVGDWTMGCVRGDLVAASFIFEDGTVVKAYGDSKGSRPEVSQLHKNTIGYIADAYGNPCIEGSKHTSAPQSLLARMFAAGIEGYGAALSDAEITRESDSGVVTELVTGEVDKYAGAKALQEGASESAQWIRQRASRLIDVVYAPAGVSVSVHLQQEIYIDKNPNARKVRYNRGAKRHANLD